jgi:hypothetical protein
LGDYYKVIECHIKALVSAREFIDRSSEGKALDNLGMVYAFLGGEEPDGIKEGASAVLKQSFLEQFLGRPLANTHTLPTLTWTWTCPPCFIPAATCCNAGNTVWKK